MQRNIYKQAIGLATLILLAQILNANPPNNGYAHKVNPFIGTGGHGHTYPGASMPFGMMQLSPDTRLDGWDGCGGYHYSDSIIYGFSHTHLSGTGIPDYCDVLLMPFTGKVAWINKDYASPFKHKNEKAHAGYYEVLLDKHNIHAALTTAYRSGMHQYSFDENTTEGKILLDLFHRDEVLESTLEIVNEYEIRGLRRSKSWATNQHLYFFIRFEKPIKDFAIAVNNVEMPGIKKANDKNIKAWFSFDLPTNKKLRVKVGISGVSSDNAKLNLDTEISHWDFTQVKTNAENTWNKELGRIEIKGGTPDEQTVFYSALYHTMLAPNIYTDANGQYRGTDLNIHQAKNHTQYSVFSLWDTHRALHPLMSIINRKRTNDWIQTFLKQYEQGGMLPVWELSGNETYCMIGYHSVPVIVDAYQKGIRDFDHDLALKAMTDYAESSRYGLKAYRNKGYLSNELDHESASKTVEYAYDDWCISEFAKWKGKNEIYWQYLNRSNNYKNLFDPSTKHIRGKVNGMWFSPFKAGEVNNFFTEGNSWHYSFSAQQDIAGLIKLHGGKTPFLNKLEELFTNTENLSGRDQADVTGLIGQYAHGNEPSHHMAYLFNFAGKPWRTQEIIHQICTEFYPNTPDGLIGNEDCGQMSAWYVLSAMGFYPVTPGSGQYIIGTPLFDEVKINLENGKTFMVKANRKNEGDFYVQNTNLNGKKHLFSYFKHEDLANGGELLFNLSNQPKLQYGLDAQWHPVTALATSNFVPSAYLDIKTNKFKTNLQVVIKNINPASQIFYCIRQKDKKENPFKLYTKPFVVTNSSYLLFYAQQGKHKTGISVQPFHQVPSDKTIRVLSEVHPMYRASGSDVLIDGIIGSMNWKGEEWHSYFAKDFEAIIDLKTVRSIKYLGIHVLQDVLPWIMYPEAVSFEQSKDGINFEPITTVQNKVDKLDKGPMVQLMGTQVTLTTRYLRVKAKTGGPLPAWHESAGSPSHIFIDEVVIK